MAILSKLASVRLPAAAAIQLALQATPHLACPTHHTLLLQHAASTTAPTSLKPTTNHLSVLLPHFLRQVLRPTLLHAAPRRPHPLHSLPGAARPKQRPDGVCLPCRHLPLNWWHLRGLPAALLLPQSCHQPAHPRCWRWSVHEEVSCKHTHAQAGRQDGRFVLERAWLFPAT